MKSDVIIYTDGACKGNPGVGGWGAILEYKDINKKIYGYDENTTNNRMELTAAIRALDVLKEKTANNLSDDEEKIMSETLSNLKNLYLNALNTKVDKKEEIDK